MIGVFDSGDGGLCTVENIRRIAPKSDICFLADRKNAPYGTKGKDELIRLVSADISKLRRAGAEKILMALGITSSYELIEHTENFEGKKPAKKYKFNDKQNDKKLF